MLFESGRGHCIFPAGCSKVKDNKDHFPINDLAHARNALAQVAKYDRAPDWYDGSLTQLKDTVKKTVAREYPSIAVNESILKGNYAKDDPYKAIDIAIHDELLI